MDKTNELLKFLLKKNITIEQALKILTGLEKEFLIKWSEKNKAVLPEYEKR